MWAAAWLHILEMAYDEARSTLLLGNGALKREKTKVYSVIGYTVLVE